LAEITCINPQIIADIFGSDETRNLEDELGDGLTWADFVPGDENAGDVTETKSDLALLNELLSTLTDREAEIVRRRRGIEGERMTLEQIEAKAIGKLKRRAAAGETRCRRRREWRAA